MPDPAKSKSYFSGHMIDIGPEITKTALEHYLQVYKDEHPNKPANMILVHRDIDPKTIELHEQWQDVTIKPWQYVHAKNIIFVGVWS